MRKFRLHDGKRGAALTIRVTPKARRTEFAGVKDDGTLRIRVAAPPSEGRANRALIEFLAQVLRVKSKRIEIVAGEKGLDKIITVEDISASEAESRIRQWMEALGAGE
ncbi:MAG TPA: DUF167 domain-containing protein [Anaerolineales bacterium]|nr:DUF167 domain-containing protein [Anaerolineales bacterium]